jgi:hypothetical protein
LAKQGIGDDQISLEQICLALRGLYTLWDDAGEHIVNGGLITGQRGGVKVGQL